MGGPQVAAAHAAALLAALALKAGIATAPPAEDGCVFLSSGDTVTARSPEPVDWYLLRPVPGHFGNMIPGAPPMNLGVDTLAYSLLLLTADTTEVAVSPPPGTLYLCAGPPAAGDTLYAAEPPHLLMPERTAQVATRAGDGYLGHLTEMLGTPFLMAPRRTPQGHQQADCRMGCDCAGLAVYGRRRLGEEVEYLGPAGIERYLEPVCSGPLLPDGGSPALLGERGGGPLAVGPDGIMPGDLLHFGVQVAVFAEDRGVPGLLDEEDLLLQSWFDGTGYWSLGECGFWGRPVRALRWREGL